MEKETASVLSKVCLLLSVICLFTICATCCSGKGEYGPEEFYQKPDGSIGYAAKYHSNNTDTLALALFIGGPLFIVFLIASAVLNETSKTKVEKKPKLPK